MKTHLLKKTELKKAALLIRSGKLIAFPTETVYGLGANALDPSAIARVFKAKGRPADNPLIVHVASQKEVIDLVQEIPLVAKILMKKFWPGPCSIVFKNKNVPSITTGGLDTVVIRMPSNKIALELIRLSGVPIAAPSANGSGKPSSTNEKHVLEDLNNKIDAIIKGGNCKEGLESTVVDVRTMPAKILRLGSLSVEKIEECIGKVELMNSSSQNASPGTKYKHYAPKAQLILVEGEKSAVNKMIKHLLTHYTGATVLKRSDLKPKKLFAKLRLLNDGVVICPSINERNLGRTVMDRLRRAASKIVKAR